MTDTLVTTRPRAGIGTSPTRPDGAPKVQGRFAFSSDVWADGMPIAMTRVGCEGAPRHR